MEEEIYTKKAQKEILKLKKEKTSIIKEKEDLEEKLEKKQASFLYKKVSSKLNTGSLFSNKLEKKIAKKQEQIDKLDLKISDVEFNGLIKPVDIKKGTVEGYEYENKVLDQVINKYKLSMKTANVTDISLIKKVINFKQNRKIKKVEKLKKINDKEIKKLKRQEEDVKYQQELAELNKPKSLDDETSQFDKSNESKVNTQKSKKIVKKLFTKVSQVSTEESTDSKNTNKPAEAVSEINFDSINSFDLSNISKLIGINTKIYEVLSKIEEDSIDEQDTSIKTSSVPNSVEVQKVSQINEPEKKDDESFLSKLIKGFMLLFGPKLFKFWKMFKGSGLFKFLSKLVKVSGSILKYLAKEVWKTLKGIGTLSKWLGSKISEYLKPAGKFMKSIFSSIKGKITESVEAAKSAFMKKFGEPLQWLKNKVGTLKKFFSGLADKAKNIKDNVVKKVSDAKDFVKNKAGAAKDWVSNKWNSVKTKAKNIKDNVVKKVSDAKDFVKNKATNIKDNVVKKVSVVKTRIVKNAKSVYKGAKGLAGKALTVVKKGIGKAVKFGKSKVAKLTGAAKALAKKTVMPMVKKIIGKVGLKALSKVAGFIPGVSILTGLGFGIYEAMKGNYKKAALEVIAGLVGSIPGVGPALGLAISVGGESILDNAKKTNKLSETNNKSLTPQQKIIAEQLESNKNPESPVNGALATENSSQKNEYDKDDYINEEIKKDENEYQKSMMVTNKSPKELEKAQTLNSISSIINKRSQLAPALAATPIANINNIQMEQNPDNIHLSEAFNNSYK